MRTWYSATKTSFKPSFLLSFLFLTSAHAKYDIARNDFTATTFVGPVVLRESKLSDWNYASDEADLAKLIEHQKTSLF